MLKLNIKYNSKALFIVFICLIFTYQLWANNQESRPRIIVTTDGETDDRCSMVRFLLYANQWDIEGIIYSSSRYHWHGHKWAGQEWLQRDIGLYAGLLSQLEKHDTNFPSPEDLKKVVYVGNISSAGDMEKDTPGSKRIVDVLMDSDPRPVYLQAWGGTNTIARALKRIQLDYPSHMDRISKKAIIYMILDQDKTFREYIIPNWPKLQVLASYRQFDTIAYKWNIFVPKEHHEIFRKPWMMENIVEGHGPLCARYEHKNGSFRSEGDSPAFMHSIDVGLRSLEHPSYGGWGGRLMREAGTVNVWRDAKDDGSFTKPIWRFARAFQNDWAARADWCVKEVNEANHPPKVVIAGDLNRMVNRKQTITLDAGLSTDPDGDELNCKWWIYRDASSALVDELIPDPTNGFQTTLKIPSWNIRTGDTIHVICEVTDNGTPALTRYARVILTIRSDGR